MPDGPGEHEHAAARAPTPGRELPSAAEELDQMPGAVPVTQLDPEQQQRVNEAIVRRAEAAAEQARSDAEQAKTAAKQARDDRQMRKTTYDSIFSALKVQVVIADLVFLLYGFWNEWDVPGSAMSAWLGAAVVQVIAVAVVVTRSLFPNRDA